MTNTPSAPANPRARLAGWIAAALATLIIVALALANYAAIPLLLGGGLAAGLLFLLVRRRRAEGRPNPRTGVVVIYGTLLLMLLWGFGMLVAWLLTPDHPLFVFFSCTAGEVREGARLTGYSASISPVDFAAGEFVVEEQLTYDSVKQECAGQDSWRTSVLESGLQRSLPPRRVQGVPEGLLLSRVEIPSASLPLRFVECCAAPASVEVKDLPAAAFFDAQPAKDLSRDEYLGRENITWEKARLEEGVRFAYYPAPYYSVHALLAPLVEIARLNVWVFALAGFLLALLWALPRMRFTRVSIDVGGDINGSVIVGDGNENTHASE